MSALRRTRRAKNDKLKYKDGGSDDEDDKLAAFLGSDSGSDFEEEIKKKQKVETSSESSSGEDEVPSEEEEVKVAKPMAKKKSFSSLSNIIKKREKMLEAQSSKMKANKKASIFFAAASSSLKIVDSLALSESSSSEDEAAKSKPKMTKLQCPAVKKSPLKKPPMTVTQTKTEDSSDEEMASQLENLAQSYALKLEDKHTIDTKAKETIVNKDIKDNSSNIASLLAQGEGFDFSSLSDEEEDDSDEAKKETIDTKKEPEVISIELPHDETNRRRKKKGFDMEAFVKRELARAQREIQMLRHQGHVLCLIAHLKYLNSFTTAFDTKEGQNRAGDVCVAIAMSIIPPAHSCSPKDLTLVKLTSFLSWFKTAFQCLKETEFSFPSELSDWLIRAMENFICVSNVQRVLIFLCAARSMGWPARLVLNLDATSIKPEKSLAGKLSEILDDKAKNSDKETKKSTDNSKESKKSPEKERKAETSSKRSKSSKTEAPVKESKAEGSSKRSKSSKKTDNPETEPKPEVTSKRSKASKVTDVPEKDPSSARSKSSKKTKDEPERDSKSKRGKEKDHASNVKTTKRSGKTSNIKNDESDDEPSTSKRESKRPNKKRSEPKAKKLRLSDSALLEAEKRKKSKNQRSTKSEYFTRRNSDSESEFQPESRKRKATPDEKPTAKGKSKAKSSAKKGCPYWVEIYVTKSGWITVDVDQGRVDCAKEMEDRCGIKPMLYVVAANADGTLKDVTKRYARERYDTQTRKARNPTESWFSETLRNFERKPRKSIDDEEDKDLEKISTSAPLPTSIGAFKSHPLYVLSRHLLKFEAIYPPDAPPLGYIKSEPIYARECVQTLHCRVTWLKEGRIVKVGQEPYKIVKARPKWDRMTGNVIKDQPLEVFGKWQTETYIPPPAVDGKVPRNEYGNVELFKPWMLPKGTVHIPITGLNRVAKKLGIDCASAMVGWEFSGGGCHPVFDGFVVCEEFQDTLMDAWNADVEEKEKKAAEKKTKKALDNWRKLIRGLLMHEKIRKKYSKKP